MKIDVKKLVKMIILGVLYKIKSIHTYVINYLNYNVFLEGSNYV